LEHFDNSIKKASVSDDQSSDNGQNGSDVMVTDSTKKTTHDWVAIVNMQQLRLSTDACKNVGPAAQTLAGVLRKTNRSTFVSTDEIANFSRVPLATCRKHLSILESTGYLVNEGRKRTPAGKPRRTCTICVTPTAREAITEYWSLPELLACSFRNAKRLNWAERVLLAVIVTRLQSVLASFRESRQLETVEDYDCYIREDRFQFSLSFLEQKTGLSRPTICRAKHGLWERKIIRLIGETDGVTRDTMLPNWQFDLTQTFTKDNCFFLDLQG
jgi:hypothetical protein